MKILSQSAVDALNRLTSKFLQFFGFRSEALDNFRLGDLFDGASQYTAAVDLAAGTIVSLESDFQVHPTDLSNVSTVIGVVYEFAKASFPARVVPFDAVRRVGVRSSGQGVGIAIGDVLAVTDAAPGEVSVGDEDPRGQFLVAASSLTTAQNVEGQMVQVLLRPAVPIAASTAATKASLTAARYGQAASHVHMTSPFAGSPVLVDKLVIKSIWETQDALFIGGVGGTQALDAAIVALVQAMQDHFGSVATATNEGAHRVEDQASGSALGSLSPITDGTTRAAALTALASALAAHATAQTNDATGFPLNDVGFPTAAHDVVKSHFQPDSVTGTFSLVADPATDPAAAYREIYSWFFAHVCKGIGPDPTGQSTDTSSWFLPGVQQTREG